MSRECKFFKNGSCLKGSRCNFVHSKKVVAIDVFGQEVYEEKRFRCPKPQPKFEPRCVSCYKSFAILKNELCQECFDSAARFERLHKVPYLANKYKIGFARDRIEKAQSVLEEQFGATLFNFDDPTLKQLVLDHVVSNVLKHEEKVREHELLLSIEKEEEDKKQEKARLDQAAELKASQDEV